MPHTPGNWKLGKNADTVVSDYPHNHHGYDREDKEYYGGYLIAESIGTDADRNLISAAPDLLVACQKAYEALEAITGFCGQNLQVYGWHLNGDPADFDNFIDENMDGNELDLLFKSIAKAKGENSIE